MLLLLFVVTSSYNEEKQKVKLFLYPFFKQPSYTFFAGEDG
ncbi:hypothetical protein RV03_GL000449 [Enterococcus gallinarum]|nr:hypothetical protein RV03_GL000449 [Enterococcus gallinarum]